jgi:hypothetical protein
LSYDDVTGCCHPVARNVATLVVYYQRCNRCCCFSNFIYGDLGKTH